MSPPVLGQIVTPEEARRLLAEYPNYAWAWRRPDMSEDWSTAYKLTPEDVYPDEEYACIGPMPEGVKFEGWMVVTSISGMEVAGRVFSTYGDAKVFKVNSGSPYHIVPYAFDVSLETLGDACENL